LPIQCARQTEGQSKILSDQCKSILNQALLELLTIKRQILRGYFLEFAQKNTLFKLSIQQNDLTNLRAHFAKDLIHHKSANP